MATKYVPPALRNPKKDIVEEVAVQPKKFEHRRSYKSHWEVERDAKEEAERERILEQEKGRELTDNNFPRLGSLPLKQTVWGGSRSFADLASEWKEKTVEDEISKKNAEDEKNEERTYLYRQNLPLPKFHNVRRFVESDELEEYTEAPQSANTTDDDAGWTLVDRKKFRREKTFEEKLAAHNETTDDSVWNANAPEEHETCWDDKPY